MLEVGASRPGAWGTAIVALVVAGAAGIALRDHAADPGEPVATVTLTAPGTPLPERPRHRVDALTAPGQLPAAAGGMAHHAGSPGRVDDDVSAAAVDDAGGGLVHHDADRGIRPTATVNIGKVLPASIERPGWHGNGADSAARNIGPPLDIEALAGRTVGDPEQQAVNIGAPLEFDVDGLPAADFPSSARSDIGAPLGTVPGR